MTTGRRLLLGALAAASLAVGCGDGDGSGGPAPERVAGPTSAGAPAGEAAPVPVDPAWERYDGPWFVWGVAADDVLNVRSGPGPSFPVITTLEPGAQDIRAFTVGRSVGEESWTAIEVPGGAGWVNERFLRPQGPAEPARVGTYSRALHDAAAAVRGALQAGDHAALADLAHPTRGVTFSLYAYTDEESPVISQEQLREAADDPVPITWGYGDGDGEPIRGTIQEQLSEIAGSTALTSTAVIGFDVRLAPAGTTVDNLADWFPGDQVVEYYFPGTGQDSLDYLSVRFVFDLDVGTEGVTHSLVGVVQDAWTI